MNDNPEAAQLDLLDPLQQELTDALESLGGKNPNAFADWYFLLSAKHIHRAADGYLALRRAGRMDSSKLLIRPAIEAMFRVQAMRDKPEILYQIAYTERLEDHKWLRPMVGRTGASYGQDPDPPGWDKFEEAFKQAFPNVALKKTKVPLREIAGIAKMDNYYDGYYRLYCAYAHAALRAIGGHSDEVSDVEDTRVMILCSFVALTAIAAIGAVSPNLPRLRDQVEELSQSQRFPSSVLGLDVSLSNATHATRAVVMRRVQR